MASLLSYLNPFAYSWKPSYGRTAPSVKAIRNVPTGINVSAQEIINIKNSLRPIPPKAPAIPHNIIFNFKHSNCKTAIEEFRDMSVNEIFEMLRQQ